MSLAASENFSDIEESLKDWQRKSALIVAVLLVAGIISIGITLFSKPEPTPEEVATQMLDERLSKFLADSQDEI